MRGFRNVSALLEMSPSERPAGTLLAEEPALAEALGAQAPLIGFLARLGSLEARADGAKPPASGTDVFRGGSVFLPYAADTDAGKLRETLLRKLEKVEKGIRGIEGKLGNAKFVENADPEVVESERARLLALGTEADTLQANLQALEA